MPSEYHDKLKVIATVNDQPLHRWVVNKQNKQLNVATNFISQKRVSR